MGGLGGWSEWVGWGGVGWVGWVGSVRWAVAAAALLRRALACTVSCWRPHLA